MIARWRHVVTVLILLFASSTVEAEETSTSRAQRADEIIARHIVAIGGAAKIKALETLRARGRLEQGGVELPFTLWRKRPNKNRVEIGFKGVLFTLGYDGRTTWWVNPLLGVFEPGEVPKEYADAVVRWADFEGPLVDYKRKGHRVEYQGEQKTKSGVLHRIQLVHSGGEVWHVYVDAKTYLEVKRSFPQSYGGQSRETTTWFREYAAVEGVRVYRVIEGEGPDGTPYTMTLLSYEANTPVDDARFEKP